MSNGARHGIGVLLGLLAIPLLMYGVQYTAFRAHQVLVMFQITAESLIFLLLLIAAALLLGVLTGPRVSPIAALIPGLAGLARGMLFSIPSAGSLLINVTGSMPLHFGAVPYILVGGMLTASALFPSRWRARPRTAPPPYGPAGYPAGVPQGPPPSAEAAHGLPGYQDAGHPGGYAGQGRQAPSGPQPPFGPSGPQRPTDQHGRPADSGGHDYPRYGG